MYIVTVETVELYGFLGLRYPVVLSWSVYNVYDTVVVMCWAINSSHVRYSPIV